jgi:hypothetical protein
MSEDQVRARVAETLKIHGVAATAVKLGLSQEAVLRIAAGARVRPGSLALAGLRLESIVAGVRYGEGP